MKLRVWKWYHNWGDDSGTMLYATEAAARQAIHSYVEDQWNEGVMDDEEFSGDPDSDIQKYFEWHEDHEWYTLDNQFVEFPELNVGDDEVILCANECAVVVAAIEMVSVPHLAADIGIAKSSATDYLNSAYNKLKD